METASAIGNIGIGTTSALATLNNGRFLVIDGQEPFLVGGSLKDLALGKNSVFAVGAGRVVWYNMRVKGKAA